jgi:proline iminopeptidase
VRQLKENQMLDKLLPSQVEQAFQWLNSPVQSFPPKDLENLSEVEWFLYGLRRIFPDAWAAFAEHIPEAERHDLLTAYLRRLTDPEPAVHLLAARAWSHYEGSCSTLLPSPETVASFAQDRSALGLARIEAHYFAHDLFLPEGGLLGGMDRIGHIQAEIVQGRYDACTPAHTAWALHRLRADLDAAAAPGGGGAG